MEKFAFRRAGTPGNDFGAAGGFGFVKFAEERGQHVRVLQVVVVAGAVKIRRHRGVVEHAVLLAVRLGELEAGDFGDGVGLVGGLERAGEEAILGHGLRRVFGVNARAAKEKQPLYASAIGAVDGVGGDGEIIEEKLGRVRVVGVDAADFRGGDDGDVGLLGGVKRVDGGLRREIEFATRAQEERDAVFALKAAHERAADHALVARDEELHAIVVCAG